MKRTLQFKAIKFLIQHYHAHTITDGNSDRISQHKTMKKNPQKYLEVLQKIVEITQN